MRAIIAVPAISALVYRAWSHNSLTTGGIIVAALTAVAHAIHPWNLPFGLLVVFFLAGTKVTKIKKDVKATLTLHSSGGAGGEGPRNYIQVLANSLPATIFTLLHAYILRTQPEYCYGFGGLARNILPIGIIAHYAAVAADTFSSELGILASSPPRLITSPTFRVVPKGTNGGVTLWGLFAGLLGSAIVVLAALPMVPFCPVYKDKEHDVRMPSGVEGGFGWGNEEKIKLTAGLIIWGALGSVLDSVLGGLFQATVRDVRTGRVIEGDGGRSVLVSPSRRGSAVLATSTEMKAEAEIKARVIPGREGKDAVPKPVQEKDGQKAKVAGAKVPVGHESRAVESGMGVLDNNQVNLLMAAIMSTGAMAIASWYWGVTGVGSLVGYAA